jgi:3-hydroxyisobutyrate dehydrogenase-like beta-hydroxyacid dehydrogenase
VASIGFVGLGIMGAPMAGRLLAAGFEVAVYNRTASRAQPLAAAGARVARDAADAATGADVVISIVTDSPDAEAVLLGPRGAAEGVQVGRAGPPPLFVDMSTIAPVAARDIGRRLAARRIDFLDAPVTGVDVGAKVGTLSILVGGAAASVERARPIFDVLGKRVTHCGPVGAGQAMKACNQILCAMNLVGVVEALQLAKHNGLDLNQVVEALSAGAGGSWSLEKLGPRIAKGDFDPGFMIRLILKDLRIVQELGRQSGVPLDGTALAQAAFADNEAHGEGELGTQAMWKALARRIRPPQ